MKYFEIKVLVDSKNTVYRDLLISSDNNLEEIYRAILAAFEFEGNQMGSFLVEGESWQAAAEFPLEALGENDSELMVDVMADRVFKEAGDQLSLIYDYMNEWKFHLEVLEVLSKNEILDTPKLIKSGGKAPNENERELSGNDAETILMNALLGDDLLEEEEDDDEDFFNSGDYESLDDFEEYQ